MTRGKAWSARILQTFAWGPVRLLFNFCCRFEVKGTEHLSGLKNAIFAVNHANELDPIIITAALSPFGPFMPLLYLAAPPHEFKHERFGWRRHIYTRGFFEAWGAYALKRGLKNYDLSLGRQVGFLQKGWSLCVFPEGGIARGGLTHQAHGGVAYLCDVTGVPIIPVSISGSRGLAGKQLLHRSVQVRVVFGAPIQREDILPPGEATIDDYKNGAEEIMRRIKEGVL